MRSRQLHKDITRVLKSDVVQSRVLALICGQRVFIARAVLRGMLLHRNAYRLLYINGVPGPTIFSLMAPQ